MNEINSTKAELDNQENSGETTRPIFTRKLSDVIDREQAYIKKRRAEANLGETDHKNDQEIRPIGMAFSGGGIRSASFNFGIVQGLAKYGFLPFVDYLTSVSGGGFTATCLTSLLSYKEKSGTNEYPFNTSWEKFPFNPSIKVWDGDKPSTEFGQNEQLRHLRENGNYLASRGGLVSRDWLRVLGSVLGGMGYIVLIYLLALIIVSALHLGIVMVLVGNIKEAIELNLNTLFTLSTGEIQPIFFYSLTFFAGMIVSIAIASVAKFNYRPGKTPKPIKSPLGLSSDYVRDGRFIKQIFWVSMVLLIIWMIVLKLVSSRNVNFYFIWLPAIFTIGNGLGLILFRIGTWRSRYEKEESGKQSIWSTVEFRSIFWAYQGLILDLLLGALTFALLATPQFFVLLNSDPNQVTPLSTTIISALGAALVTYLSSQKSDSGGSLQSIISKIPSGIMNALLSLFVIVFNLSLVFLIQTGIHSLFGLNMLAPWIIAIVALFILWIYLNLININHISPHYFFRDRVGDVFLKTAVTNSEGEIITARDQSQVKLTEINPDGCSAPYHIVVGAINLPGSYDLKFKYRKSQHFNFSRDYTGSEVTGYALHKNDPDPKKRGYRKGATKYARTIAISGAAASSAIGYVTSFAQAFVLTLFNVRLGMWMINPEKYDGVSWNDSLKPFTKYEERRNWFRYLWDEVSATISERRHLVNLSDGGHTGDNGALYPLFQRRCKVIFAGDASQDPKAHCNDLFRVIHFAKVDLGIDVNINVDGLKPKEENEGALKAGWSKHHCAVGEITYPEVRNDDNSVVYPEEKGWLVYFKPSISPKDRGEIKHYWETHKNDFPHPSTADQFFDEIQFEIQRFLGDWTVELTLKELLAYYKEKGSMISEQINELVKTDDPSSIDQHLADPVVWSKAIEALDDLFLDWQTKQKLIDGILNREFDYEKLIERYDDVLADLLAVMKE